MENTKNHSKAAKAREKWRLLQQEQKLQNQKIKSEENAILLKVAHKRQKTNDAIADSA
jgi:hypothetical protein